MSVRRATSALLAVLALAACGGSELPTPAPTSVTPASGSAATATPIVIHGTGFSVLTVQPSSGGAPTVDATFQAWVGDRALDNVRWVDDGTLSATVPAGLAAGPRDLRVQGPFGTSGGLAGAFTVEGIAPGSLSLVITAAPASVNVGQAITVTLTVTNTSPGAATGVVPESPTATGTGTVGAPTGPVPASIASLAPGASGTFTWTYTAAGPGTLAFSGAASMTLAGATVRNVTDPSRPAPVTIARPAALTASLPAAGAGAVGQEFSLVMTVTNAGGAGIRDVVPTTPTPAPGGMATLKPGTGAVPASLALLAAGTSATFTWTFVAGSSSGTVQFASAATGTDVNSGATVASGTVTSGNFTIGAAGMLATLSAVPATANVDQAVALTLTVTNPGLASVQNLVVGTPTATSGSGASAIITGGPSPSPPPLLAAGQTVTITWTCSVALTPSGGTGRLDFLVTLGGVDAFSGAQVTAQPGASVTVQTPATVTATGLSATPSVVGTDQSFTVTLAVEKAGTAPATITGATLTGTSCASPPATPVVVAGPTNLTWTGCAAPATPGTLDLTATAAWVDGNAPLVPRTTASSLATVQVLQRASLAADFEAQPQSPVSAGQPVNLVVNVRNLAAAGGEAATGVAVAPIVTQPTGTAGGSCSPATPALATIPAGSVQPFAFTCLPSGSGTLTFTAIATGTGASTGQVLSTEVTTAPATTILAAASLAATFLPEPTSPVSAGQVVQLALTVQNAGETPALAVVVDSTFALGTGTAAGSCTAAAPGPLAIAAGGSQAFTFDCTVSGSGTLTFGATVAGVAEGSGATLAATALSAPVTVQIPATVAAASLVTTPATGRLDSPFSVTLTVGNSGEAGASVTGVSLAGLNCAAPAFPVAVVGATAEITWTACDPLITPDPVVVFVTVTWVDVNVPGSQVTNAPWPAVVQAQ